MRIRAEVQKPIALCRSQVKRFQATFRRRVILRRQFAIPGHHTAHISPDAVTELIQQFRAADFLSALSKYQSNWTDYPTQTISLHINGQVKTVVDYFGEDVGLPLAISNLETAIDKAAGTKRWIEGNDERGSAELGVLGSTLRFVNL